MGPLLGPTLANIFKCSFESEWLQDFPNDFKPVLQILHCWHIFCDKFATNIYRKKSFNGFYNNFKSFIPETYNIGLIKF